ncbi:MULTISPECIES: DUF2975 domain-containing protein [Virgibacillus]|uniref:DUF2975 domain-containing protein n=2 Tax=Virgibacillus TaxID=84406 RepID=A0A024QE05_9BACI|nr:MULTISPECIES: DUF2975 domain-containing protein [Virgibacillus]EQB36493.1 hypothetical protein M948_15795 [Virgibacillus sp. CM-4]MYL42327.1 DUF2975 domain-containing protein [Virgibacillus massiliensis]GGJ43471.1 putative membrane protein YoaS [Virgibacillus kapii]CDQ40191.1 hypothetical protein BN990_02509 [Virgibacillus massiliensis]
MKRETLFLRVVVFILGIPILGLCIVGLPRLAQIYNSWLPELAYLQYPLLIVLYATAIPFFFALYQTLKLLTYIDKNKAFSELSVMALKNIKHCATTISALYVLIIPILYLMAEIDDAPGIVLLGLVIIFASIVIAVFAAVLQKLLKNAIEIKSENDLTV